MGVAKYRIILEENLRDPKEVKLAWDGSLFSITLHMQNKQLKESIIIFNMGGVENVMLHHYISVIYL